MCGIAGIVTWNSGLDYLDLVERMIAPLKHRGPDDHGVWVDSEIGIGLGHRRLSIQDLSPLGHQPMCSGSGRYVIAFNGEIYNHLEIKRQLEVSSHQSLEWRGHSDTETLLAAIDLWGVEPALQKAVGMFSIALWDKSEKSLTLARDRMGEKPLYYGIVHGKFVFASELKAIQEASQEKLQIDRCALAEFMRFGYVPAPKSIYSGIGKLPAGHLVTIRSLTGQVRPKPYWSLDTQEQEALRTSLADRSDNDLVDLVHDQLEESIKLQSVSDVPLGAFLSGGVDSSLIVAMMQAQSSQRVRTYTIGFDQPKYNEAPYAREVARHLGTDHTEMYVSSEDALNLIPDLALIYDEPFADSSQIPTTLLSRLTRQHVTVSLSGDGGDELFAGYPRYLMALGLQRRFSRLPNGLRSAAATLMRSASPKTWDSIIRLLPASRRKEINGHRVHRLAQLMNAQSVEEMYVCLMSQWHPDDGVVLGAEGCPVDINWPGVSNPLEAMRRWDVNRYLSDDILVKVDRASMSASLESRAPLLDHRIVETAFALPDRVLVRDGVGKWVLRTMLDRYVPRALIERPKAGFTIPLGDWLRGSLRDWAEAHLKKSDLIEQGLLDADKVDLMWQQHLAGTHDRSPYLWNVLMFQTWLREQQK